MAYVEWGDPGNPKVLICVHGLTRCGRDFDFLAQAMADEYRVVCPDVVGRGRSDWLRDKSLYALPQYCADMTTLLAKLDVESVHWVGTSMGGLIGMALACQPETPITRLVLNDVGPVVTGVSLQRIGDYLGNAPRFKDIEQADTFVRTIGAPFGKLTAAQWRHLTVHVTRAGSRRRGGVCLRSRARPTIPGDVARRRRQGRRVVAPVRRPSAARPCCSAASDSDLLTHDTALQMTRRGPLARLVEIPDAGHAPMLLELSQVLPIRQFLLA
jgi:pimeloyl-ACP methyl ester carboxylesterase